MYRTPLVMPRISRYLSVWLPYTENFSEWHFKNCVDLLRGDMMSRPLEFPNVSRDGREFPDPLERFSAVTDSYDMLYVLESHVQAVHGTDSAVSGGRFQFYGCVVSWTSRPVHPVTGEPGMLFTGRY